MTWLKVIKTLTGKLDRLNLGVLSGLGPRVFRGGDNR